MIANFRETFCAQYAVPPELYDTVVLRLTLYPHARWLARMSSCDFLTPDRSFIARVGRLTGQDGFADEATVFQSAPENRRFWRRLRIRVSITRMSALFREVMGAAPATDR